MDEKLIELIEKIGRLKLLVEEVPYVDHSNACPADDPHMAGPCKCKADRFNGAVEKVKYELGIGYLQKLGKR